MPRPSKRSALAKSQRRDGKRFSARKPSDSGSEYKSDSTESADPSSDESGGGLEKLYKLPLRTEKKVSTSTMIAIHTEMTDLSMIEAQPAPGLFR